MQVHPLHVVVLILGVLYGIRHMDVGRRSLEQFPGVDAGEFGRWKELASGAYRLGFSACFAKVLLDFVFAYVFRTHPPPAPVRWGVGLTLDVGWLLLVVVSYFRIRRAHKLAEKLGVERAREKSG